jgi:HD-like signal output (HDOD) protein
MCLRDPEAAISDVVQVLRHDVAMTATLMKLANSGFFGLREPVHTMDRAVSFIGMEAITALALGQHSLQTAAMAMAIALHESFPSAVAKRAFLAGMLHDVGRLVFATHPPPHATCMREQWVKGTLRDMESHHPAVGAYLLGLWGFPESVVEALVWHHAPSTLGEHSLGLCGLVHIGDQLSHGRDIEAGYLQSLGLERRLCAWRELFA